MCLKYENYRHSNNNGNTLKRTKINVSCLRKAADLVTFTEEILDGTLQFLCNAGKMENGTGILQKKYYCRNLQHSEE